MSLALSGRANLVRQLLVAHGGMFPENATVTLGIKGDTIRNAIEVIDGLHNDNRNLWQSDEVNRNNIASLRLKLDKMQTELNAARRELASVKRAQRKKPATKAKPRRKK